MTSAMSVDTKYSDYYSLLDESAKKRYSDKINSIGLQVDDPYTFNATGSDAVPNIEFLDLFYIFLLALEINIQKKSLKLTRV